MDSQIENIKFPASVLLFCKGEGNSAHFAIATLDIEKLKICFFILNRKLCTQSD
jgi:hypothetical protein